MFNLIILFSLYIKCLLLLSLVKFVTGFFFSFFFLLLIVLMQINNPPIFSVVQFVIFHSLLMVLMQINYLADCSLEIFDDPSAVALVEVVASLFICFFFRVSCVIL